MSTDASCGTYAGAQRHRRHKEPTCEECKAANAKYMADHRRDHPEEVKFNNEGVKARSRALTRLGRAHPGELAELLAQELRKTNRMVVRRAADPDERDHP